MGLRDHGRRTTGQGKADVWGQLTTDNGTARGKADKLTSTQRDHGPRTTGPKRRTTGLRWIPFPLLLSDRADRQKPASCALTTPLHHDSINSPNAMRGGYSTGLLPATRVRYGGNASSGAWFPAMRPPLRRVAPIMGARSRFQPFLPHPTRPLETPFEITGLFPRVEFLHFNKHPRSISIG